MNLDILDIKMNLDILDIKMNLDILDIIRSECVERLFL